MSCLLIKHTKQTIFYRTSSDSPKSSDLFSNADKIIDYLKFKNQLKVMRGFVLLLKILADAGRVQLVILLSFKSSVIPIKNVTTVNLEMIVSKYSKAVQM